MTLFLFSLILFFTQSLFSSQSFEDDDTPVILPIAQNNVGIVHNQIDDEARKSDPLISQVDISASQTSALPSQSNFKLSCVNISKIILPFIIGLLIGTQLMQPDSFELNDMQIKAYCNGRREFRDAYFKKYYEEINSCDVDTNAQNDMAIYNFAPPSYLGEVAGKNACLIQKMKQKNNTHKSKQPKCKIRKKYN